MPGVADRCLQTEAELVDYLDRQTKIHQRARIIGVSGPGDPLADPSGLSNLLSVIEERFSDHKLCLCTSGQGFDAVRPILFNNSNLSYITFTVNTLRPETAAKIYNTRSNKMTGVDIADAFLDEQERAVRACVEAGLRVKINTIFLPGLNADEIIDLFKFYSDLGVGVLNLLSYKEGDRKALPSLHCAPESYQQQYRTKRQTLCLSELGNKIKKNCRQCRADYCGQL